MALALMGGLTLLLLAHGLGPGATSSSPSSTGSSPRTMSLGASRLDAGTGAAEASTSSMTTAPASTMTTASADLTSTTSAASLGSTTSAVKATTTGSMSAAVSATNTGSTTSAVKATTTGSKTSAISSISDPHFAGTNTRSTTSAVSATITESTTSAVSATTTESTTSAVSATTTGGTTSALSSTSDPHVAGTSTGSRTSAVSAATTGSPTGSNTASASSTSTEAPTISPASATTLSPTVPPPSHESSPGMPMMFPPAAAATAATARATASTTASTTTTSSPLAVTRPPPPSPPAASSLSPTLEARTSGTAATPDLPSTLPTASTSWRTVPAAEVLPAASAEQPHQAALRPLSTLSTLSTPASASRGSHAAQHASHRASARAGSATVHRRFNSTMRVPASTRPPPPAGPVRDRLFVEETGVLVMDVSPAPLDNDSAQQPDGWNGTYFNESCRNYTNDYCVSDEEYLDMMLNYMQPTKWEWVIIAMHATVFVGGLVGNALVCLAVYRNHTMRTVTNYFIVNLAVADFLVILMCLPPTVLWDVTETWFMGTALCKVVLYFQTVSVTVSVLTLTFISVDRWYAICFPLKFKSTTSRAKKAIIFIWLLALSFDVPELVVLETKRKPLGIDTIFFTQCLPTWGDSSDTTFHCVKTLFLFFLPLAFMTYAYVEIVKVLWSKTNIPGHAETKSLSYQYCNGNGVSSTRRTMNRSISATSQILSRRKAAKMLVVVVLMFFMCYLPVHLLSILRYTMTIPQTELMTLIAMFCHWLCYANSAVNPLIYNFMSGKFRGEFRLAFQQCACESLVLGGDTVRPAAGGCPGTGSGTGTGSRAGHVVLGMAQLQQHRPAPGAPGPGATATTALSVSVLDAGP